MTVSINEVLVKYILPVILFLSIGQGCSHKKKHQPSGYEPAVAPIMISPTLRDPADPNKKPGSANSPQMQQLPKASVKD